MVHTDLENLAHTNPELKGSLDGVPPPGGCCYKHEVNLFFIFRFDIQYMNPVKEPRIRS